MSKKFVGMYLGINIVSLIIYAHYLKKLLHWQTDEITE